MLTISKSVASQSESLDFSDYAYPEDLLQEHYPQIQRKLSSLRSQPKRISNVRSQTPQKPQSRQIRIPGTIRDYLPILHNESLLNEIAEPVKILRDRGCKIYCVRNYPQVFIDTIPLARHQSSMNHQGSIWIHRNQAETASQLLGIDIKNILESALFHEVGHTAGALTFGVVGEYKGYFFGEEIAWNYAAILNSELGTTSSNDFQKIKMFFYH